MLNNSVEGAEVRFRKLKDLQTKLQSWLHEFPALYKEAEDLEIKAEFLHEITDFINKATDRFITLNGCECHADSSLNKISVIKEHFKNLVGFKPNSRPTKNKIRAAVDILLVTNGIRYGDSPKSDVLIDKITMFNIKDDEFWLAIADLIRLINEQNSDR